MLAPRIFSIAAGYEDLNDQLTRISHMESVERGHLPLGTAAATVGRPVLWPTRPQADTLT